MPVTVYRLRDAPVLMATFTGEINGDVMVEMFQRSRSLIAADESRVYRISDFRTATTNPLALLSILKAVIIGGPGSPQDRRIIGLMVGDNQWVKIGHDTLMSPAFGSLKIPMFTRMGDALEFIRHHHTQSQSGVG